MPLQLPRYINSHSLVTDIYIYISRLPFFHKSFFLRSSSLRPFNRVEERRRQALKRKRGKFLARFLLTLLFESRSFPSVPRGNARWNPRMNERVRGRRRRRRRRRRPLVVARLGLSHTRVHSVSRHVGARLVFFYVCAPACYSPLYPLPA